MFTKWIFVGFCLYSFNAFASVIKLDYQFDNVVRNENIYDPISHYTYCCEDQVSLKLSGTVSLLLNYSTNYYRFSNTQNYWPNVSYYETTFVEKGRSIYLVSPWGEEFDSLLSFSPELTNSTDTTYTRIKLVFDHSGVYQHLSRTSDTVYIGTTTHFTSGTEFIGDYDSGNYTEITSYFYKSLTLHSNVTTSSIDYSDISASVEELLDFIQESKFRFTSAVETFTAKTIFVNGSYESQVLDNYTSYRYEGELVPVEVSESNNLLSLILSSFMFAIYKNRLRRAKSRR